PVIGSLFGASAAEWADNIAGFRRGLADVDFVEGRNVVIEYRWAENSDRMAAIAADLISRKVAVIVTGGNTEGVRAVLAATRIIPIVFTTGSSPRASRCSEPRPLIQNRFIPCTPQLYPEGVKLGSNSTHAANEAEQGRLQGGPSAPAR